MTGKVGGLLLLFFPVAIVADALGWPPWLTFLASGCAILPLAAWLGRATEELAGRAGAGLGALLNATFGNATELIIALFAIRAGLLDVVKASLAGSVIGNILFVLGLAVVVGGARRPKQTFNRVAATTASTSMALAVVGLTLPAVFALTARASPQLVGEQVSLLVSALLIVGYVLSLVFSLRTHAHLYAETTEATSSLWPVRRSLLTLFVVTLGVAVMSETLVDSVEGVTSGLGWSALFIGVILLPIIGNSTEHMTAVTMASKDKMDLSMGIAFGSSTQIALFVAPVLVFASLALGHPMDLIFQPIELLSIAAAVLIATLITLDGESNWFEGAQLLIAYGIVAGSLFLYP